MIHRKEVELGDGASLANGFSFFHQQAEEGIKGGGRAPFPYPQARKKGKTTGKKGVGGRKGEWGGKRGQHKKQLLAVA